MEDIGTKYDDTTGSDGQLSADEYNDHNTELQAFVENAGLTLSSDDTPDQMTQAGFIYGTGAARMIDNGTANAIQLTPYLDGMIVPGSLALFDGLQLTFYKDTSNTSETITVEVGQDTDSYYTSKSLVLPDGSTPDTGIVTGSCIVRYDATNDYWVLDSYNISSETIANYLDQSVKTTASPAFVGLTLSDELYCTGLTSGDDDIVSTITATESSGSTTAMTEVLSITSNFSGTIQSYLGLRRYSSTGDDVYAQIYINGSAVGTLRTATSTTYEYFTEDIDVEIGDTISVYGYVETSGSGFIAQLTLQADAPPIWVKALAGSYENEL